MLLRPAGTRDHASRFSMARARSHRFLVPFFGVFVLPSVRRPSLQKLAKARVTERRAGQNK